MEKELWKYLKSAQKPIVLYGMGNGADKIINVLEKYNIKFQGVFASDGFVRNKSFHGLKISSYNELKAKFSDMIVLLCFGSQRPEVIENVIKISKEQELYAPDVDVIGNEVFTLEYLKQHKTDFEFVYSHLADKISKNTFENILNYKISGKIDYLLSCEVEYNEPYESFLSLNQESFLDLGAYNGDTVIDFMQKCPNFNKITAVEPDIKTFRKLKKNTENIDITLINACISQKCGKAVFAMKGGRNSSLGDNGIEIPAISIDSLNQNFTYIKMDVEGEELNAINGGENLIKTKKPKMLISAYHKSEDLIKIPKKVLNLNPDYKMYLRHFSYIPAWDTNYYFV